MYVDFKYHSPKSISELFGLFSSTEEPLVYAGGTDLLVLLRSKKVSAKHIIDIKKLPELSGISQTDEWISIGATECFSTLSRSELVKEWAHTLNEAARQVGSEQIRNKGTIGGNIQTASPAGDGLVAALGLDAELSLLSPAGERRLTLSDFVLAPRSTALKSHEIIVGVHVPKRKWNFQRFFKVGLRNALAISVVNGAVTLSLDSSGIVTDARIVLGAVAPTPVRIKRAEDLLAGCAVDAISLVEVAQAVRESIQPITDIRASAEYRSYIAGVMVKRQIEAFKEVCSA